MWREKWFIIVAKKASICSQQRATLTSSSTEKNTRWHWIINGAIKTPVNKQEKWKCLRCAARLWTRHVKMEKAVFENDSKKKVSKHPSFPLKNPMTFRTNMKFDLGWHWFNVNRSCFHSRAQQVTTSVTFWFSFLGNWKLIQFKEFPFETTLSRFLEVFLLNRLLFVPTS